MIEASQIERELLASLSTQTILRAILNNSFLLQFDYGDNYIDTFNSLRETFNAYSELFDRANLLDVLVSEYEGTLLYPDTTDYNLFFKAYYLELFVLDTFEYYEACPPSLGATSILCERFAEHYSLIRSIRNSNINIFSDASDGVSAFMNELDYQRKLLLIQALHLDEVFPTAECNATLLYSFPYTPPGGYQVIMKVYQEMTATEIQQKDASTAATYPQATKLNSATMHFNCHSFAWYSQNTSSNIYWIDDPGGFYPCYTQNVIQQLSKVRYVSGQHSAILINYNSSDPSSSMFMSKWGSCGVYLHSAYYGPSIYQYGLGVIYYY